MKVEDRDGIPRLLAEYLPDVECAVSADASLDLYDFLKVNFTDGILIPQLWLSVPEEGVLGRCFDFVELLLASPVPSIRSAAAFQIVEPLFDDERLLVAAFPRMGRRALEMARNTLDLDCVSSAARASLSPYM